MVLRRQNYDRFDGTPGVAFTIWRRIKGKLQLNVITVAADRVGANPTCEAAVLTLHSHFPAAITHMFTVGVIAVAL